MTQFKPKLRRDAHIDFAYVMSEAFKNVIKSKDLFPYQNCISCKNFDEKTEICKQYKARPPARVICYGCDNYHDKDEIPF